MDLLLYLITVILTALNTGLFAQLPNQSIVRVIKEKTLISA